MKYSKLLCCIWFVMLLCAPVTQYATGVVPRWRVEGIGLPRQPARPTLGQIRSTEFQAAFEKWFERRNGLWEYFVRLDNQINFSVFSQTASSYVSQVLLGRELTLFQRFYLDEFNNVLFLPDEVLEARVTLLKQAQDALAKRGIPFLLVLSANHLAVNQAFIGPEHLSPNRHVRPSIYERMVPMLERAGVNYLDTLAFFRAEFTEGRLHFTRSGSHWDPVGACLVASQILDRAEILLGKKIADLRCDPVVERAVPRKEELDLVRMANLWTDSVFRVPTKYPQSVSIRDAETYKPSLLFVGTSFVYSLLQNLELRHTVKRTDFFFYYREHRKFPGRTRALDPAAIDLGKLLERQDMVIVECSTALMHDAGFGFLKDLIERY